MAKIKAFFSKVWQVLQNVTIGIFLKVAYAFSAERWHGTLSTIIGAIVNAFIVWCIYKLGRLMLADDTPSLIVGSFLGYPLAKLCGKYAIVAILKIKARLCK